MCSYRKVGFLNFSCSGSLIFLLTLLENRTIKKYNSILIPYLFVDIGKRKREEPEQVSDSCLSGDII